MAVRVRSNVPHEVSVSLSREDVANTLFHLSHWTHAKLGS